MGFSPSLTPAHLGRIIILVLGSGLAVPALALDATGPLVDALVDASSGELSAGDAQAVVGRLNQYDLSAYSLTFSDGSTVSLGTDAEALNRAINARANAGQDLQSITGPGGTLTFGAQDVTCGNITPDFEADAVGTVESCLGARLFTESVGAVAASALAQINTIDLLINRPTTQFMTEIRRFVRQKNQPPSEQESQSETGGGSGDESLFAGPWGIYFQGGGSFSSLDRAAGRTGFNLNNQMATAGVDYRFSDKVVAGFLFNFTGSDATLNRGAGQLDSDLYRFMPFVSITPLDNVYIDIMAGYSYHNYSSIRSNAGASAQADYSADQAMASINMGYTHAIGALELTPFIGGAYVDTEIGGYTEKGRGALMKVGGYQVSSWTSTLGLQLAYAYSASFGVLQPHLKFEWLHEYANDHSGVSVFVPSQSVVVSLPTARPIRDWGNLSAGVQAVLPNGVMGFVNYQAQVMDGGQSHLVEGGIRVEF